MSSYRSYRSPELIILMLIMLAPFKILSQEVIIDLERERIARARGEQEDASSKIIFNGMLYMMGWIGRETNYAYIYDNDSYIGLGYNFSKYSKVFLDIKLADILKPSNVWADSEMYGEVDFLAEAAINRYSLILKLGKFNSKNSYFGEYAMGIGKDYIADQKSNLDMMNGKLTFRVNSNVLPLELSFMGDLDFGQRPSPTVSAVSDWNNKGLSLIGDAKITALPLTEQLLLSFDFFYNDQFYVNEKTGNFMGGNGNYIDANNRTTYLGASSRLFFDLPGSVNYSLGASIKHFDIKKDGYNHITHADQSITQEPVSRREQGVDFDVGLWLGNYGFIDGRIAFLQNSEARSKTQRSIGIETNLYMIPRVTIYGGVAVALEPDLINYGTNLKEGKARYGWDIGVIYNPVKGVLVTGGWQKMVRFDDMGYFYIKATYWW